MSILLAIGGVFNWFESGDNNWTGQLIWNTSAVSLAIVLVFSLRQLRRQQKEVSGIICNERLMTTHSIAFISATLLGLSSFALTTAKTFYNLQEDCEYRLAFASQTLQFLTLPAWLLVQMLILVVFYKYGKPLQNDTKVLLANKLQAI